MLVFEALTFFETRQVEQFPSILEMLRDLLEPKFTKLGNSGVWLQDDIIPVHTLIRSMVVLRELFPENFICLRGGSLDGSACSPYLFPFD